MQVYVVLSECMSVDVPSNENGNSLIINLISVILLSLSLITYISNVPELTNSSIHLPVDYIVHLLWRGISA